MNFTGHLIGSSLISLTVPLAAYVFGIKIDPAEYAVIIPSVIIGANLGDIDTASKPSRYYAWIASVLSVFWVYNGNTDFAVCIWIPFIAAKMFPHRNWTHSKVILPVIIATLPFTIGFISTLISKIFNYDMTKFVQLVLKYNIVFLPFAYGFTIHNFIDSKWFKKIRNKLGFE